MKRQLYVFLIASSIFATGALAQSTQNAPWLGVWQGELDGQPSVVLTLADDSGQLGGTLVLGIIKREGNEARLVAREPHVLMNPHTDGQDLSFQSRKLDGGILNFNVVLADSGKATIHCSNCGENAPTVDLIRAQ